MKFSSQACPIIVTQCPLNRMSLQWAATETQALWHSIFGRSDWMMGPKLRPDSGRSGATSSSIDGPGTRRAAQRERCRRFDNRQSDRQTDRPKHLLSGRIHTEPTKLCDNQATIQCRQDHMGFYCASQPYIPHGANLD